jgi:hypothetical protein
METTNGDSINLDLEDGRQENEIQERRGKKGKEHLSSLIITDIISVD